MTIRINGYLGFATSEKVEVFASKRCRFPAPAGTHNFLQFSSIRLSLTFPFNASQSADSCTFHSHVQAEIYLGKNYEKNVSCWLEPARPRPPNTPIALPMPKATALPTHRQFQTNSNRERQIKKAPSHSRPLVTLSLAACCFSFCLSFLATTSRRTEIITAKKIFFGGAESTALRALAGGGCKARLCGDIWLARCDLAQPQPHKTRKS